MLGPGGGLRADARPATTPRILLHDPLPDLRTWRGALTWHRRGADWQGAAVEGRGLASGLRERTRQSSPGLWFCGAFQGERSLLSSRGGRAGAGRQEAVPRLIKAPLHPPRGFSLCRGPEAPRRPIAGEGLCESPPPERRSPEAALGRGPCGENTIPSPTPSPSDVTRATSRGSRGPSPPSPFSSPSPPALRALGRCYSADLGHRQRWGWGRVGSGKSGWQSPRRLRLSFPRRGPSPAARGSPSFRLR